MGAATVIGVGAGIQAYGAYKGLRASEVSAKYQAQIDRNNAIIKEKRIEDLRGAGAKAARRLETEATQFIGEQVTAFASGGIDISSAVVSQAVEESARVAAADIIELQHNIERDVWGLQVGIESDKASELLNKIKAREARKAAPIAAAGAFTSAVSPFIYRG